MSELLQVTAPVYGGHGDYRLYCTGELNASSYRTLRDTVVKAALDQPRVVLADVNELRVPDASAWSVFTSARWHVSIWPDVPIMLVCARDAARELIRQRGVTRYVPVFATAQDALQSVGDRKPQPRQRARAGLPRRVSSIVDAQRLVGGWLSGWSCAGLIPVAAVVATTFVENVLRHTDSAPTLRLEYDGRFVTVAVEDASSQLALRKERTPFGTNHVPGLDIVAALAQAWGNLPSSGGKTVWARVGLVR